MSEKIMPLPSVLDAAEWEIRDSGKDNIAYVDFDTNQIVVPVSATRAAEQVRAHEAMHIAITPHDGKLSIAENVEDRTIQALEDCRVNAALRASGISTAAKVWGEEEEASYLSRPGSKLEAIRCSLALRKTGNEDVANAMLARFPGAKEIAEDIAARFEEYENRGEVAPFDLVKDSAEYLTELIENPPPPKEEPKNGGKGEKQSGGTKSGTKSGKFDDSEEGEEPQSAQGEESDEEEEKEDGSPADGESDGEEDSPDSSSDSDSEADSEGDSGEEKERPKRKPEPKPQTQKDPKDAMRPFSPDEGDSVPGAPVRGKLPTITKSEEDEIRGLGIKFREAGSAESAEMTLIREPLVKPYKQKKLNKRSVDETGAIPTAVHRVTIDNRVFSKKLKKYDGAAVLIDCSASMFLSEDDIDFILSEAPSATVALYGQDATSEDYYSTSGALRIIVENKMMALPSKLYDGQLNPSWSDLYGKGNVCDVPALEWLANRRERMKLWISDGVVTGKGDAPLSAPELRKAAELIRRGRIIRVNHLQDLKKSHLLRFAGDNPEYQAEEFMTEDGYDLNGDGCSVCSDPNCQWWANYKRQYLLFLAGKGRKPNG